MQPPGQRVEAGAEYHDLPATGGEGIARECVEQAFSREPVQEDSREHDALGGDEDAPRGSMP
jgi:hypothetical protein